MTICLYRGTGPLGLFCPRPKIQAKIGLLSLVKIDLRYYNLIIAKGILKGGFYEKNKNHFLGNNSSSFIVF